jgi:ATP-dependent Lhr-like helicase
MVFELLHPRIQEALRKLGIKEPLETQKLAIPKILEGKNVLIISPTGSGKTEAAMLGVFHLLLTKYSEIKGVKALYITPLRSLNRDLEERFRFWSKELGLKISVRHGDTPSSERARQVREPPDVLILTPETLQAILPGKNLREILKTVKFVIVDELHELLNSKRGVQLTVGLERLVELAGEFQRIALSATIGEPELAAKFIFGSRDHEIVKAYLNKRYDIHVAYPVPKERSPGSSEGAGIFEDFTLPEVLARLEYIVDLIRKHRKVLIFCNTRTTAEVLAHRLSLLLGSEKEVAVHHSSLSRYVRIFTEQSFRKGALDVIVATSSLELGIDIGDIDLVIQYKSPKQVTRLLQRVGRAGHRITEVSKGVIVAENFDDVVESSAIIRLAKRGYLEKPEIHYGALDVLAHQIAGILMDFGKVHFNDIYRIVRRAYPYKDLTPEKLHELLTFLDKLGHLRYFSEDGNVKKSKYTWRYYYFHLSMIPEETKFEVVDKTTGTSVGFLDEKFVAEYGNPGQKFIHKGSVWQIVEISGTKIFVVPAKSIEGTVPSWIGEELPVPYDVAQMYGRILAGEEPLEYVDDNARQLYKATLEQQSFYEIPNYRKIVIEWISDSATVIHAHFGYKVNNTLSKVLSSYLVRETGEPIASKFDAYRIVFFKRFDPAEILCSISSKEEMLALLIQELERTTLFRWRFWHVAKRFGILKAYREGSTKRLERLIEYLRNTPVYEETLNEILLEKFDVDLTWQIIKMLQTGELELRYLNSQTPSPLARLGLEEYKIEIHRPRSAKALVLEYFRRQLENTVIKLRCQRCGKEYLLRIKDIKDPFICECGSKDFWIFLNDREERNFRKLKDLLIKRSELFKTYGKKVLYLFVAKSIKPEEYANLAKLSEQEIIEKVIERERRIEEF